MFAKGQYQAQTARQLEQIPHANNLLLKDKCNISIADSAAANTAKFGF